MNDFIATPDRSPKGFIFITVGQRPTVKEEKEKKIS
jgi:hypothetical protein